MQRPSTQWPNFDPAYLNIVAAGIRSVFSRSGSFCLLQLDSLWVVRCTENEPVPRPKIVWFCRTDNAEWLAPVYFSLLSWKLYYMFNFGCVFFTEIFSQFLTAFFLLLFALVLCFQACSGLEWQVKTMLQACPQASSELDIGMVMLWFIFRFWGLRVTVSRTWRLDWKSGRTVKNCL